MPVGVNAYRLAAEDKLDVLRVDNDDVYRRQLAKLERLRAERDADGVRQSLDALTAVAAERASGNLLEAAVEAARAKATVGEISDALETVLGRHRAVIRTISGVYRSVAAQAGDDRVQAVLDATAAFERAEGRRPRILVAKMGQDGHDRGQKVIVTAFADMGFDVDVGPLFSTPEEVAQQAVDLEHEFVEMDPALLGDGQRADEQVHQHRLAASHAAPQIDAGRPIPVSAKEPGKQSGPVLKSAGKAVERRDRALLCRVRLQFVRGDQLVVGRPDRARHRVGAFGRFTFFSVPLKL